MRYETTRPIDLALVALLALAAPAAALALPEGSALRVAIGLPFLLVAPGYALVALLFPERARRYMVRKGEEGDDEEEVSEGLEPLERAGLALGLSIAVVPLLGLGLNFTPWGIRLVPILAAVSGFTLLASGVAVWRRARLPAEERLAFAIERTPGAWGRMGALDKALTVLLVLSVVAAAGALAYVLTTPRPAERFTEFYVLGPGGRAEGYPSTLSVGGEAAMIIGVVNHEGAPVSYVVETVWVEGAFTGDGANRTFEPTRELAATRATWRLEDGATREENVTLVAPDAPAQYRVELRLHKDAVDPEPYRRLHLYVEVR